MPVLVLCLASSMLATGASGQTVSAGLTGSLTDADGLPVANAQVVATRAQTNARYATASNEVGFFHLSSLPAGEYVLRVERAGFATLATQPLTLELGQTVHARLKLDLGRVEERVAVEYRLPLLQTESAVVGEVVTGQTVSALPLSGRNIAQLALLLPGAVSTAPASMAQPKVTNLGRPYVNGQREQGNSFILDGVDITGPLDNLPSYQPSPEALEEVRIETNNYSAQHGNLAGALIHAIVKSGTNELHGGAYELFRHDGLDANRWEANRAGAEKGRLRQHTFGGFLGGPILKDRLFFFGDFQELRKAEQRQIVATVAPPAWRRGDFSDLLGQVSIVDPSTGSPFPGNVIPSGRIHPIASALVGDPALYPLPNEDGSFVSQSDRRTRTRQGDFRLSAHPSPRDSGFLRLSYQGLRSEARTDGWAAIPTDLTRAPFVNAVLNWNHGIGIGGLAETRFGYTRNVARYELGDAGLGAANEALGLEDSQSVPGLSAFNLGSGLATIGNAGVSNSNTEEIYSASERVSMLRGRHNLTAGAQWLYSQVTNSYSGNSGNLGHYDFTGAFTGFGFSDFLLGLVSSKGRGGQFLPWQQQQHRVGLYVEDSLKARHDLTLTTGLRWSFYSPLVERHDRQVNFDLATGQPLYAGTAGNSRGLYDPFYGGFEPRLGIAWTPRARLSLRAGYGIVQFMEGTGSNLRLTQNPPFFYEVAAGYDRSTGPGGFGFGDVQPQTEFVGALRAYDPQLKPQFTQQWNAFLQYAPTHSMSVNVGYVGNRASRVVIPKDFNQPLPGEGPAETWLPTRQRRPLYAALPDVTAVLGTASEGNSNYNGLQVIVRQRSASGLEFLASYSWSKAMSDNVGYYGGGWNEVAIPGFYQQNAYDRRADYGPAFFDVRHNFVVSATYAMPEWMLPGWTVSSVLTARTGFPITVIDSRGRSQQASLGFERPDRVGNGAVPNPTLDRWLDITAFQPAAIGTFGNSGVGILRAPGYFMWDLGLSRSLDLGVRKRMTFRIEAFNVLNHPNFGYPGRDLADPAGFGRVTSTIDAPRQLQLSLKLEL